MILKMRKEKKFKYRVTFERKNIMENVIKIKLYNNNRHENLLNFLTLKVKLQEGFHSISCKVIPVVGVVFFPETARIIINFIMLFYNNI